MHFTPHWQINKHLTQHCLVLCYVVTAERQGMFCVCDLINYLPPSLSSLLFYHIKLISMLFSFYALMKTIQLFDFHIIPNCSKAFKVISWKLWEQELWMILTCVTIINLWVILAIHCKFLKNKKVSMLEL